jgi:hypothetical protein
VAKRRKRRQDDQDVPRRRGELIDDERDKKPERDEIPDTPPTEPQPVPVEEPPPAPDKQGRLSPAPVSSTRSTGSSSNHVSPESDTCV